MEAENYLAGGYGIRSAMEARRGGRVRFVEEARVWQPNRLKGIQVSPEFGTPFLAAGQLFDLRATPRKWLSIDRTDSADERFVESGTILVTCSGAVGRATLAQKQHEKTLITHDLLRVAAHRPSAWGWIYAYLRAPKVRAMMLASQYGQIIKHLEISHLSGLPLPSLRDSLLAQFEERTRAIVACRDRAHALAATAEAVFEDAVGSITSRNTAQQGFSVSVRELARGRRRFEGYFHNPHVRAIRRHFAKRGRRTTVLGTAGFKIWLPTRFRRIPASDGVPLLDSSDLFEVSPDVTKRIADIDFGDPDNGRVRAGWLLLARSGQIYGINGSVTIANAAHEGKVVSDHVIRIAPAPSASMPAGYVAVALSHPALGRPLVKALAYGSSIPEIDPGDVQRLEVVRLGAGLEQEIATEAERAAALFAEADILEASIAADGEAVIDAFLAGTTGQFVA